MLSIIIPVYNGEKTIEELYQRIKKILAGKEKFEVIFVFDCGSENSWEKIKKLQSKDPEHIRGYHLKTNYGQHNATLFGINKSKGDFIVTMDEDLQYAPDDIFQLLGKQKAGNFDVVYGNLYRRKQIQIRTVFSFLLSKLLIIIIPGLNPHYSSFRLIKKEIANRMKEGNYYYIFLDGILFRLTHNISSITVNHHKSKIGESSYTFHKLLLHILNVINFYSSLKTWLIISGTGMILPYILLSNYNKLFHLEVSCIRTLHYVAGFGFMALFFGLAAQITYYFQRRRIIANTEVEFTDEC